jgi:branched-chain amino acid transport system permease protein
MTSVLLFALLGLGGGAVIALLSLGVVGEYQASGVVNFAHGAIAMYSAYCFTELRSTGDLVLPIVALPHRLPLAGGGMASGPAILVTLVYSAAFGAAVYLGIFRWLRRAPALAKVVASIGLMLTLQALAVIHFGTAARPSPRLLPSGTVTILGATVGQDRVILAGFAVVAAVGLPPHPLRRRDPGVLAERARGCTARMVAGSFRSGELGARLGARRPRRRARGADHVADADQSHAGDRPCPGRCPRR